MKVEESLGACALLEESLHKIVGGVALFKVKVKVPLPPSSHRDAPDSSESPESRRELIGESYYRSTVGSSPYVCKFSYLVRYVDDKLRGVPHVDPRTLRQLFGAPSRPH